MRVSVPPEVRSGLLACQAFEYSVDGSAKPDVKRKKLPANDVATPSAA